MVTPRNRLDTAFGFRSNAPLQRDLQLLTKALEARFAGVESVTSSFEDEVHKFEELGLSRLNDVLTPLASEALARLQDITQLFGATSTTSVKIEIVEKQFLIPVDQRNTYVPTPFISILAVGVEEKGMIAQRISFNRDNGILTVMPVLLLGSGTYSSWELSVSPAPSLSGYTKTQADTAIAAAIASLTSSVNALLAYKAPLASPTLTGSPLSTTPAYHDDSTRIPTTAWVNDEAKYITDTAINELVIPPSVVADVASVAQVRGATAGTHAITTPLLETVNAAVALTDATSISIDWKNGINFTVTLAGNRTLNNPSNGIPGSWRTIQVTQDANGARTLAYGNQYVFPGGAAAKPIIGTGNGAVSRLSIYCRTTSIFEVYGVGIGLSSS